MHTHAANADYGGLLVVGSNPIAGASLPSTKQPLQGLP